MKNIIKVAILVVSSIILSVTGYANDLHLGFEIGAVGNAGFSHSKASHKFYGCLNGYCDNYDTDEDGSTIAEGDQIENNRQGGLYFDLQVGADVFVDDKLNVTPYVDLGAVHEFDGASPSFILGLGLMSFMKANDNLSYLAGIEVHDASFVFRNVEAYSGYGVNAKETPVSYDGGGLTLSGGILYDKFTVKLIYISNSYKLQDFDSGDKFNDNYLASQFPKTLSTQSLGLSVGMKF